MEAVWLISFKTVYKPMNWTSIICTECCSSANFQNSTVRTHYPSAHQPSLAVRPRTHLLQTGRYYLSIHPRHLSVLPILSCFTRVADNIQMTAAVFYLISSVHSALRRSKAGVSGFWCHRLERPASPRRICTVTRGFQDLSVFTFLPRHYHMTYVNAITIYHYCLDICRPCNN